MNLSFYTDFTQTLIIPNGFQTASIKFTIQSRQAHAHQTPKGEYIKNPVSPSHILYLSL